MPAVGNTGQRENVRIFRILPEMAEEHAGASAWSAISNHMGLKDL
jgi:hypothetical protein